MAFWYSLHGVFWIDRWLTLLAAAILALSFIVLRGLWRNPVFAASCLAGAGYLFFIGFHNNMQPRYYQVVAFPLVIVVALGIEAAHRGGHALRHACATRLLAEGLSLKEIGDHLGHRSTSATSTYAKVNIAALREVAAFDLGDVL